MTNLNINVWIGNLGKYNEGELIGDWFTLPVDFKEVAAKIGLNAEYEEYHICDWEAPDGIKIDRYSNLEELNEIAESINALSEWEEKHLEMLLATGDLTFEEAAETLSSGEYSVHYDCEDMADVAYKYYEESGLIRNIPENIVGYIDWERVGRDMDIEGYFYQVNYNTFIELY